MNEGLNYGGTEAPAQHRPLREVVGALTPLAVAVSGGVDSLTLASFAHQFVPADVEMFHAVSPAVPPEATQRVRALAERQGWKLTVFDAGEFGNADYRRNPVNRCYFCKTSLYDAIRRQTQGTIVSGTNVDDLGEYRPGLSAASLYEVRHPYVEAGLRKRDVRQLARTMGLGDVADLPAAPCLASRVETGLRIEAATLRFINEVENLVRREIAPNVVRCRVRRDAVSVELDPRTLERIVDAQRVHLRALITPLLPTGEEPRKITFEPYRVGSAFLTN
ncbi:MAG TPA: hypothetical protein VGD78_00615 [Chthoniobacterales bacterium]